MFPERKKIIFIAIFCALSCLSANATDDDQYALEQESYQVLNKARELMQEESYSQALAKIQELLSTEIKLYDAAVAYQTLAYIYISMNDYPAAIDYFERALEGNYLPPAVDHQINYTMAQLLIHQSRPEEGITYLERWLARENNPDKEALLLAAFTYYQIEEYIKLIPVIEKVIVMSDTPDQSHYELLFNAQFQIKDYKSAVKTINKMIRIFPENDGYWLQLVATYYQAGDYDKALAIYEIALKKQILSATDILQMARLYLNQSLPYKAGKLLSTHIKNGTIEDSIENLESLASSWLLAREFSLAIDVLNKIATRTNDPEIYFRIGRITFDQEKWQDATEAFQRAINNKISKNVGETYLLMGIAAFNSNNSSLSSKALTQAFSHDATREQARWWLKKLGEKMEQQDNS